MSLIYGMETFFLPRGLLMHSSSLSFQKTHIFHTGSYTLEFMLLLVLLLLSISTYIYANVKQNMQPNKSSKMKKIRSPSPKVMMKIKNASRLVAEKSAPLSAPVKVTAPTSTSNSVGATPPPTVNKKRSSVNCVIPNIVTSSPRKKKSGSRLTFPHRPRLKSEIQRNSTGDVKVTAVVRASITKTAKNVPVPDVPTHESTDSVTSQLEPVDPDTVVEDDTPILYTKSGTTYYKQPQNTYQSTVFVPAYDTDRHIVYVGPSLPLVPLKNWSVEEDKYIEKLVRYVVPPELLPMNGFPFMLFLYSNYGVFYSTPSMNYSTHRGPFYEHISNTSDFQCFENWVSNELQISQYFQNQNVRESRECCRCKKKFFFSKNGQCWYHRGKLIPNFSDSSKSYYLCCMNFKDSQGCTTANDHVWNGLIPGMNGPMDGFVITEPSTYPNYKYRAVAIDCEMCYTIKGLELTRVTMLNLQGEIIYDTLVMPQNPIIDYNTKFSGITKESMEQPGATKSLAQVQHEILQMVDSSTIFIGHGLENDLRALKMVHFTVIDTSLVHPKRSDFKVGKRYSLKNLTQWYLHRTIQDSNNGHDSAEDAQACLDLVRYMVDSEIKPFHSMS